MQANSAALVRSYTCISHCEAVQWKYIWKAYFDALYINEFINVYFIHVDIGHGFS